MKKANQPKQIMFADCTSLLDFKVSSPQPVRYHCHLIVTRTNVLTVGKSVPPDPGMNLGSLGGP